MAQQSPSSSGYPGVGQGDPLLGDVAGAASSALPQDPRATAAQLIQQLTQARMGQGGGLVNGPQPAKPIAPLPPVKAQPQGAIPQGPFASTGERKRADKQAAFNTIANIVNKAQDRLYQQKVQKIQHDMETMSNAITGYNEAKAAGDQAKMKHNADIINNIAMDPKKSKELAKAFDVNMNPMAGGDSKKKEKPNPSADAAKAFFTQDTKNFQSGQSMLAPQAQAMMRAMPQTYQQDPRFSAMLEATKAGLIPKAGELLTFQKGLMDIQQKINANQLNNETKMKIAQSLSEAMSNRTIMQQYGATLRTQMMQFGAQDRAQIMADAWKYRADKSLQGQTERTNVMRQKLLNSPDADAKKLKTYMDGLEKAAKKNTDDMKIAVKQGDHARAKELAQQAEGLAYQQRLANDRAERLVGIEPPSEPDQKNMGLSDDEYRLYIDMMRDMTRPSGKPVDDADEE